MEETGNGSITYSNHKPFWLHPTIHKYLNASLDVLMLKFETFIIRKHEGGLICFGLDGDKEHFHSIDFRIAILKALAWQETKLHYDRITKVWSTERKHK